MSGTIGVGNQGGSGKSNDEYYTGSGEGTKGAYENQGDPPLPARPGPSLTPPRPSPLPRPSVRLILGRARPSALSKTSRHRIWTWAMETMSAAVRGDWVMVGAVLVVGGGGGNPTGGAVFGGCGPYLPCTFCCSRSRFHPLLLLCLERGARTVVRGRCHLRRN